MKATFLRKSWIDLLSRKIMLPWIFTYLFSVFLRGAITCLTALVALHVLSFFDTNAMDYVLNFLYLLLLVAQVSNLVGKQLAIIVTPLNVYQESTLCSVSFHMCSLDEKFHTDYRTWIIMPCGFFIFHLFPITDLF